MTDEVVTLVAGGGLGYSGWTSVDIQAAINEACRSFRVETTERPGEYAFPPGTPIAVLASGDTLLTGYVNAYQSEGEARSHKVTIQGRSKGQDFVDSSGVHPTGYANDKTPDQFAQELDLFGIGIRARIPLTPVPKQQLQQGETCFRCVERYLRSQAATMMGEPDGSISITNASVAERAAGALIEGVNILRWSVALTDGERFQAYTSKGQSRHGRGAGHLRIKETARDSGVRRARNRVLIHEGDTDSARAKKRAHHERERAAGLSCRASITVQGWRDAAGKLWRPNTIAFVDSPTLMHLVQDMLIERVAFSQRDDGTKAVLDLVDPRAYQGKGQTGKKTDGAWNEGWSGEGDS